MKIKAERVEKERTSLEQVQQEIDAKGGNIVAIVYAVPDENGGTDLKVASPGLTAEGATVVSGLFMQIACMEASRDVRTRMN